MESELYVKTGEYVSSWREEARSKNIEDRRQKKRFAVNGNRKRLSTV